MPEFSFPEPPQPHQPQPSNLSPTEADISDDPRYDDGTGTGADPIVPGPAGEQPGGSGAASADDFFRSLSLPYAADTAGEGGPGPAGADDDPWASGPTSTFEAPADPQSRRAHFVGAPQPVRRRGLPKPVIVGIAAAAALALVVVGLVATGGDSPEVVRATPRTTMTRPIPTLPTVTTVTEATDTTTTTEEPVPETKPRATGNRGGTVTVVQEEPPTDPPVVVTDPPAPPPPPPAPVAPGAPTMVVATSPSSLKATITWLASASPGSSAITEYRVVYADHNDPNTMLGEVSVGLLLTCDITVAVAGNYDFWVWAINAENLRSGYVLASNSPLAIA